MKNPVKKPLWNFIIPQRLFLLHILLERLAEREIIGVGAHGQAALCHR